MRQFQFALAMIAMIAALSTGCGSIAEPDTDGTSKAAVEPQGKAPSNDELRKYFEYLATGDPDVERRAVKIAAPKSNAAAYATYMSAYAQANRDAGFSSDQETVKSINGGFAMCGENDDDCSKYTKIKFSRSKIADFSAGAKPLRDRIALGNGESKQIGPIADAKMIAAYKSISGDLVVVFEIKALQPEFWPVKGIYVSADGRQSENTDKTGPDKLRKDARANYIFSFEGANLGGTVTITAYGGDDSTQYSGTFETR